MSDIARSMHIFGLIEESLFAFACMQIQNINKDYEVLRPSEEGLILYIQKYSNYAIDEVKNQIYNLNIEPLFYRALQLACIHHNQQSNNFTESRTLFVRDGAFYIGKG